MSAPAQTRTNTTFTDAVVSFGDVSLFSDSNKTLSDSGPQHHSVTDPANGIVSTFTGSARGMVSNGRLSAHADASVHNARETSLGSFDDVFVDAEAEFDDTITLNGPAGGAGLLQIVLPVHGSATATGPADISLAHVGAVTLDGVDEGHLTAPTTIRTPLLSVPFGQPITLDVNLEALVGFTPIAASFTGKYDASGSADFAIDTPALLVFDENGRPLPDVTVSSEIGAPYARSVAVPLPSAANVGGIVFGCAMAWLGRRRSRHAAGISQGC